MIATTFSSSCQSHTVYCIIIVEEEEEEETRQDDSSSYLSIVILLLPPPFCFCCQGNNISMVFLLPKDITVISTTNMNIIGAHDVEL